MLYQKEITPSQKTHPPPHLTKKQEFKPNKQTQFTTKKLLNTSKKRKQKKTQRKQRSSGSASLAQKEQTQKKNLQDWAYVGGEHDWQGG